MFEIALSCNCYWSQHRSNTGLITPSTSAPMRLQLFINNPGGSGQLHFILVSDFNFRFCMINAICPSTYVFLRYIVNR